MTAKIIIKRQSIKEFVTDAIAASDKSQKEIADEMGLDNANLITMWKNGSSRVPPNRILSLANALEVDAWFFLRLALLEYYPQLYAIIEKVAPSPLILTKNEIAMIKSFREVTDFADPVFRFNSSEVSIIAGFKVKK